MWTAIINAVVPPIAVESEQWLKGELFTLVSERTGRGKDSIKFYWRNDQGKEVSARYSSQEMAKVHFGAWIPDEVPAGVSIGPRRYEGN